MSLKIGNSVISKIYVGSSEVQRVYQGSNLIYGSGTTFNPLSLSPMLWLDGNDESTFSYSSGSDVNGWNDKSGNNYHYSQSTAGRYPTRISGGVKFNPSKFLYRNYFNSGSGSKEIIAVVKQNATLTPPNTVQTSIPPYNFVFFGLNTIDAGDLSTYGNIWRPTTEGGLRVNKDVQFHNAFFIKNEIGILNYHHPSGATLNNVLCNKNNEEIDLAFVTLSGVTINPLAKGYSVLGSGEYLNTFANINVNYFDGDIYELLFFDKELTTTERSDLHIYLANKWNIDINISIEGLQSFVWLDATDTSTITKDGSNFVSVWADKSGNGNNAIQEIAVHRPTNVNGGILIDNQIEGLDLPLTSTTKNYTTFFAMKLIAGSGSGSYKNYIFDSQFGRLVFSPYSFSTTPLANAIAFYDNIAWRGTSTLMPLNTTKVMDFVLDASTSGSTIFLNNLEISTGLTYNPINISGTTVLGGTHTYKTNTPNPLTNNSFLNGYIYEILIFDKVLTPYEKSYVTRYLKVKHGLNTL